MLYPPNVRPTTDSTPVPIGQCSSRTVVSQAGGPQRTSRSLQHAQQSPTFFGGAHASGHVLSCPVGESKVYRGRPPRHYYQTHVRNMQADKNLASGVRTW
jgi:hypothetical protein